MEKVISVAQSQLDDLLNAIDQLRISTARTDLQHLDRLERVVWELQVKMLAPLIASVRAAADDLAVKQEKKITFYARDMTLGVSHQLYDVISAFLVHGVRNAIDHGFVPLVSGAIDVRFSVELNSLTVQMLDDGSGPDMQKIESVALEKKLVNDEMLRRYSRKERLDLLFRPGFSTRSAEESGLISGRGVGLSSVRTEAAKVGGSVWADEGSHDGNEKQSGFVLGAHLPVDLLVLDVAIVEIDGHAFAVPSVDESAVSEIRGAEIFKNSRPATKLFRRLDSIWRTKGGPFVDQWFEHARFSPLACFENGSICLLLDLEILKRLKF